MTNEISQDLYHQALKTFVRHKTGGVQSQRNRVTLINAKQVGIKHASRR